MLRCMSCLYMLDIHLSLVKQFANIFPHLVGCRFVLSTVSFPAVILDGAQPLVMCTCSAHYVHPCPLRAKEVEVWYWHHCCYRGRWILFAYRFQRTRYFWLSEHYVKFLRGGFSRNDSSPLIFAEKAAQVCGGCWIKIRAQEAQGQLEASLTTSTLLGGHEFLSAQLLENGQLSSSWARTENFY